MVLKIIENRSEGNNCFSLVLEKPAGFSFYPGQYLDIELPVKDNPPAGGGNTRAFTISSSPTEDFLMITPKKGLSPFKKFMETLQAGDMITTSHPAGTFALDESTPAVFIAGGIGITPFRSIIKWMFDQKINTPVTLIYINSDQNFPFKDELDQWKSELPNLKIIYITGRLTKLPSTNYHLPIYYLAGSLSFVNNMAKILIDSGIDEASIRYDRFDGYE